MVASMGELLVVIIVASGLLLVFGVKKIPELAKALKESRQILTEKDSKESGEKTTNATTTTEETK